MSAYGFDFRDRAAGKQKMKTVTQVRHYKRNGEYVNRFGIMGKGAKGQNLYTSVSEEEARRVSKALGKRIIGKEMGSPRGSPKGSGKASPKRKPKASPKKPAKKSPKKSPATRKQIEAKLRRLRKGLLVNYIKDVGGAKAYLSWDKERLVFDATRIYQDEGDPYNHLGISTQVKSPKRGRSTSPKKGSRKKISCSSKYKTCLAAQNSRQ
jgi:hypothetical protein